MGLVAGRILGKIIDRWTSKPRLDEPVLWTFQSKDEKSDNVRQTYNLHDTNQNDRHLLLMN